MTQLITDYRTLDTLDDRREIITLLAKLPPRRRFDFLDAVAKTVPMQPGSTITPRASWFRMGPRIAAAQRGDETQDNALTNEIYTDLFAMSFQYGLQMGPVTKRLEAIVRRLR